MDFKIGRLDDFISNVLEKNGYALVRICVKGIDKKKTVQVMFEKADGENVTIDDCERASKVLAKELDEQNIIRGFYNLELSSCGVNRPLTKKEDFSRFCGKYVNVYLHSAICDLKSFNGLLLSANDYEISVEYDSIANNESLGGNIDLHRNRHNKQANCRAGNSRKCVDKKLQCTRKETVILRYEDIRSAHIDGWRNI